MSTESLSDRLATLERKYRRLQIATGALAVAGASVFLLGFEPATTLMTKVQAQQIELVDGSRRPTMTLYGSYDNQGAALVITDPARTTNPQRVAVLAGANGIPTVTVGDAKVHTRLEPVAVRVTDSGGTNSVVLDGNVEGGSAIVGTLGSSFVFVKGSQSGRIEGKAAGTSWHVP